MTRFAAILLLYVNAAAAQCVMCLRTASAQQVERAKVLNLGILIMLIPALLIPAGFLFLLYRRSRSFADDTPADDAPVLADQVLEDTVLTHNGRDET